MSTNLLIAPTEPKWLKDLGSVRSLERGGPEKYGADVLILPHRVGIQRKEFGDLLNSLADGRLQKEMAQLTRLPSAVLVIEGHGRWTSDGALIGYQRFTRQQFFGLLLSIQLRGVWVLQTDDEMDTIQAVREVARWFAKNTHDGLERRPKERSVWGTPDAKDYCAHVLQALPGCGPTLARNIVEKFGLPITWTVTEEDLRTVDGVGKGKAAALIGALGGPR